VHYFLHPVCVMDHPSCATGPASQRLWLRMAVAELRWFFWRAWCWRDSMQEWERQYHIGRIFITTYFKCSMSPC